MRTTRRLARTGLFLAETIAHGASSEGRSATPRERARHLAWVAENLCALHGIQIVQHGVVPDEPCIVVANHVSYVEPLALLARVPATAVAKREVGGWPIVGDAARSLGVLFVDRARPESGARVLLEAWRLLSDGVSVVVFPEGTTTRGDDVLPFRRGVFGLAKLCKAPILPVAVRYGRPDVAWVGDDPFVPHYLRTTGRARTRVHLRFGEPIRATDAHGDAAALAERAREAVLAMLDA